MLAFADVSAALLASLSLVVLDAGEGAQFAWSLALLPAWIVLAKLLGLYDRDERALRHLTVDEVPQLVLWAVLGAAGISLYLELGTFGGLDASSAIALAVVAGISGLFLRAIARFIWRVATPRERVAIIGSPATAQAVERKIELFPDTHMAVVPEYRVRHLVDIAPDLTSLTAVDRVFYAPQSLEEPEFETVREAARATGIALDVIPPLRSAFGTAVQLNRLADLPVLAYRTNDLSRSTLFLKRVLDVTLSSVALVVVAPLLAVAAIAIKLEDGGPVLFRQWRSGEAGKPFHMIKLRTMVDNAEALLGDLVPFDGLAEPMFKLSHDPRVTRTGRFLRRWSLDELPQLVNVVKGEMSLVGPRPEQLELVERYSDEQKRVRLALKPGMTGPMQVYGRGRLSLSERVAVEQDYMENLSVGRDLRILGMTLPVVLGRRGAY
jgi:exopolysaccharide biosynthesis polyprenyl glycosylphosphotransferase